MVYPLSLQMANLVTLHGEDQPFIRNVMTLRSCSPIVGADVMSFDTEREVFLAWRVIISGQVAFVTFFKLCLKQNMTTTAHYMFLFTEIVILAFIYLLRLDIY